MTSSDTDHDTGMQPLLSLRDFTLGVPGGVGVVPLIRGVNLDVGEREIVGLVGESGSGKSLTARAILNLLPTRATVSGSIHFEQESVFAMRPSALRRMRGRRASMIFQDPMASLNPMQTVGAQIGEAILAHSSVRKGPLRARIVSLLTRVGIPDADDRLDSYPHEFSGGMRQRAVIAMAIANDPSLIIADEPTTALDVTVQDQILDLLRDLNQSLGTAILLITHNFAVIASICQRVAVMYAGQVVEEGPVEDVLADPQHPYTWSLLKSVPRLEHANARLPTIDGRPPDPAALPTGCSFEPRCCFSIDRCREAMPALETIAPGRQARCWVLMRNAASRPL
ncbi:MAG: oligopeptide/dipeptide transporter, ATPase subunit [Bradyrhizobium sp.]|nr:oligopeptide/dipeptide transporter, ATPase subunit [Bradyrhizobium sp.]